MGQSEIDNFPVLGKRILSVFNLYLYVCIQYVDPLWIVTLSLLQFFRIHNLFLHLFNVQNNRHRRSLCVLPNPSWRQSFAESTLTCFKFRFVHVYLKIHGNDVHKQGVYNALIIYWNILITIWNLSYNINGYWSF